MASNVKYPLQDARIVGTTNRSALSYKKGEEMVFTFKFVSSDTSSEGLFLTYNRFGDDGITFSGTVPAGETLTVRTSIDKPGFVCVSVILKNARGTCMHYQNSRHRPIIGFYAGAGVEPEYHTDCGEPEDFDAFWEKVLAENNKLEMLPQLELVPEKCTPKVNVYSASFQNLRKGCRMYGTMCVPADMKPGDKLPAILIVPGAGCRARTGFYAEAEKGYVTLEVGINHIPTVMDDEIYAQLKAGMMAEYQFYNMDDKEKYVYRGIYAGCARAVDFLAGLDFVDADRIGVTGGSQGGALSITTAALNPKVKCLAAFYPALADMTGYLYGRGGGWPHPFRNGYMATKERIETSRYYDVVNFARKINVPAYVSYGFNDMICCPTSTTAAYNAIPTADKERWIVPEIEHWTYPEQNTARSQWMMEQLKK